MSEPAMNILSCNCLQSLFESFDQIRQGSGFEATQDGLDLRPGQFNRVEVCRVRGQVDQVGTLRADQRFQPGHLMSRKIVQEQDITTLEGRDDTLFDITIEHRAVDCPRQHQRCGDPGPADDCQGRRLRSRGLWHTVHHALVRCGAPIQACQVNVYAGFIQKFEVFHIQFAYFVSKLAALAFHSWRVSLAGMERLFFRGNFSRTRAASCSMRT
jgi:hypothetical protein